MKIGIECQRLFRKEKHGMDIVALELIRQLQILDTKNEYYIFVKRDEDNRCLKETPNFKIVEVPGSNYFSWEQIHLPRYARKYQVDILHCTSNTAPLFCPVPLVLTLHDIIFLEKLNAENTASTYQKMGAFYRKYLVPPAVRKSRKIITVSQFEKNRIIEHFQLPENRISVVYNGVHSRFRPDIDLDVFTRVSRESRLPGRFFFYLGNSAPKKNLANVVRAFAEFAEKREGLHLVIAESNERMIKPLLDEMGKGHLIHKFEFPGYIPPDRIPVYYKLAEVFLYPSLRESFGLPIIEAMACGTPVITSTTSAMPEIAGDAALLADPQDVSSLVKAMEEAVKPDIQAKLRKKGLQRAAAFSWQQTASKVLNIYQQLNTRKKTPAAPVNH